MITQLPPAQPNTQLPPAPSQIMKILKILKTGKKKAPGLFKGRQGGSNRFTITITIIIFIKKASGRCRRPIKIGIFIKKHNFSNIGQNRVLDQVWSNFGSGFEFCAKNCTYYLVQIHFSLIFEKPTF